MKREFQTFSSLLALCALSASISSAAPSVAETIGFQQLAISPGLKPFGLPLMRPSVGFGQVASSTTTAVTGTSTGVNYGSKLDASTAYYLELTGGPVNTYVGERFDVNVVATISSANNQIVIDTASANNTLQGNLPDLSGYKFVVRPHLTLAYVFGTNGNSPLLSGSTAAAADQVQFWNRSLNGGSGGYDVYYLAQSGTVQQWRKNDGTSTNYDNLVIPAGVGLLVKRNGTTSVQISVVGTVRTTPYFAQNLKQGSNLIAEGYPADASPASRQCTTAAGWTSSSLASYADQIQVWNVSLGAFETYYYGRVRGVDQWRKSSGGKTVYDNTLLFKSGSATFVKKIYAQPDYAVPKPY